MDSNKIIFVAVHAGAGNHSREIERDYKKVLDKACKIAFKNAKGEDAVENAIKVLEDDPITNSGTGSNLNEEGKVECDASIMDSSPGSEGNGGAFGAVGAVGCIRNPISVAAALLKDERKGRLSLGRIRPIFLVGEGASIWSKSRGIPIVEEKDLITKQSQSLWETYKDQIKRYESKKEEHDLNPKKKRKIGDEDDKESELISKDELYDTVGAICIDSQGNIAAGVSSGGIHMKHRGRVGEAAIYGAGCWAEKLYDPNMLIACSATGVGEQIMKSLLSSSVCKHIIDCEKKINRENSDEEAFCDVVKDFLQSQFLMTKPLESKKQLGGLICARAVKTAQGGCLDFVWAHTTASIAISYMSSIDKQPRSSISRLSKKDDVDGHVVRSAGITLDLKELILQPTSNT